MASNQDTQRIELINGGAIEVDRLAGTVQTWDAHSDRESDSTVVHPTPEEWRAFVAAGERVWGREPGADRYRPSTELIHTEVICAALYHAGATKTEALDAITREMQERRSQVQRLLEMQPPPVMVMPASVASTASAARIVDAIVADLSDRRGLRHEWEGVDEDMREEIKAEWRRIAEGALRPATDSTSTAPKEKQR